MTTAIVIAVIVILVILALVKMINTRKKGGCASCGECPMKGTCQNKDK